MLLALNPADSLHCSDWELLRLSADGAADAYGELVRRHHSAAVAFCAQILGDRHAAEDTVQRGFLNIYRTRDRHVERAQFKTFLYRALLNLCLNELARRKIAPQTASLNDEESDWVLQSAPDRRSADPPAEVEKREFRAMIDAAAAKLNPKHRAALYLRDFEGLPYEQVAVVLEASLSEIKIWIHRGRKRLAVLLRPYWERGEAPA